MPSPSTCTGSSIVISVELTAVVEPLTVRLPVITALPPILASPVTVRSSPIVTSSGKARVTVTSVPDLATLVAISFAVPTILKSSVRSATSSVPASASTVKEVAILTFSAAVILFQ